MDFKILDFKVPPKILQDSCGKVCVKTKRSVSNKMKCKSQAHSVIDVSRFSHTQPTINNSQPQFGNLTLTQTIIITHTQTQTQYLVQKEQHRDTEHSDIETTLQS